MKKILVGCLIVGILLLAAGGALFWYLFLRKGPELAADLALPTDAEVGSNITMVVTASNANTVAVTLDSIDISDSFLAGFQVVEVQPKASDTMHVSIMKQRSWTFERPVPAGGSQTVTFTLRPIKAGHFSGDVDVCNPSQDFKTMLADVVVRAPSGAGAAERRK